MPPPYLEATLPLEAVCLIMRWGDVHLQLLATHSHLFTWLLTGGIHCALYNITHSPYVSGPIKCVAAALACKQRQTSCSARIKQTSLSISFVSQYFMYSIYNVCFVVVVVISFSLLLLPCDVMHNIIWTPNLQDVHFHTLHLSSGTVYPATS